MRAASAPVTAASDVYKRQGYGSGRGARTEGSSRQQEGEVKVYRTSETPEKRVSEDVGDYVEFEETKGPRA